jgi:peptidyl-prolyl cis-trans isomerase A (cyclophilin A)
MTAKYLFALILIASVSWSATSMEKIAAASKKTPPKATKGAKKMFATVETSMGTFKILLYADKAPKTVENFVGLAKGTKEWTDPKTHKKVKRPFYNGLTFHRIIKGFMIQGGDPAGDGTGGPGYTFADEFNPQLRHSKAGILAMANAGPNTNGSQFYITVAAQPRLDDHYSVFGEVVEHYDVVQKISETKTGPADKPVVPVIIKSIRLEEK